MKGNRIEYIDAMRGITMLLVVMWHVELHCLKNIIPFSHFVAQFRMPLFFFISGWVLYKANFEWKKHLFSFIKNKFRSQILSTLFFGSIFGYLYSHNNWMLSEDKDGYWFTYVLFEFFFFYSFVQTLSSFIENKVIKKIPLIIITCFIFILSTEAIRLRLSNYETLINVLSITKWGYFPFFVLGAFTKKHFDSFLQIINSPHIYLVVLFLFICTYFNNNILLNHSASFFYNGILGIIVVFKFCHQNQNNLSSNTKVGRLFIYIGRRTLDIYLIHYCVLPYNLHIMGEVFKNNYNIIIQLTFVLFISLIVILFSLFISGIIRTSPLLAHYILGVKK